MRTRQEIEQRIARLKELRATRKAYCYDLLDEEELHGVEDAASDLRDLDAACAALEWVLQDSTSSHDGTPKAAGARLRVTKHVETKWQT